MLSDNMKVFTNTVKHISKRKGYTLLFAVIVSVLVLSIAAFILSISRKEAILSSSARDSVYAFYSADSALECVVENLDKLSVQVPPPTISCGGTTINLHPDSGNGSSAGTTTFSMLTGTGGNFNVGTGDQSSQSGAASCASTSVSYVVSSTQTSYTDPVSGSTTISVSYSTTTTADIRGYNIGWNQTKSDCSRTGPRKVERSFLYKKL
jgi:hypothetical protein